MIYRNESDSGDLYDLNILNPSNAVRTCNNEMTNNGITYSCNRSLNHLGKHVQWFYETGKFPRVEAYWKGGKP